VVIPLAVLLAVLVVCWAWVSRLWCFLSLAFRMMRVRSLLVSLPLFFIQSIIRMIFLQCGFFDLSVPYKIQPSGLSRSWYEWNGLTIASIGVVTPALCDLVSGYGTRRAHHHVAGLCSSSTFISAVLQYIQYTWFWWISIILIGGPVKGWRIRCCINNCLGKM